MASVESVIPAQLVYEPQLAPYGKLSQASVNEGRLLQPANNRLAANTRVINRSSRMCYLLVQPKVNMRCPSFVSFQANRYSVDRSVVQPHLDLPCANPQRAGAQVVDVFIAADVITEQVSCI